MTDTSVELEICADCACVLANGECGTCALHDVPVEDCPHGGNDRYPARFLMLGDWLDLGWTMGKDCPLCKETCDGTDWHGAVFDPR